MLISSSINIIIMIIIIIRFTSITMITIITTRLPRPPEYISRTAPATEPRRPANCRFSSTDMIIIPIWY